MIRSPLLCWMGAFVLVVVVTAPRALAADWLEGTKWKVKVTPDGDAAQAGAKPFDDTLSFKGSIFTSAECQKKHGFAPGTYEDDTRGAAGGMQAFTAEIKSEKEGRAKWSGTVTADQIKGELVWTKKDGSEVHYMYSGERLPQK